jgi:hypothetical protein
MLNVVMGLLVLAGSVVRDGNGYDDLARREADRAAAIEVRSEALMSVLAPDSEMSIAQQEVALGVVDAPAAVTGTGDDDWDVACERKQGGELVFDRRSVRELGNATLFRWSATRTAPEAEPAIYTAVVDCRAKTIEASWPGKRTTTRAGSCGRHLIEAVCAAASPRAHRASR